MRVTFTLTLPSRKRLRDAVFPLFLCFLTFGSKTMEANPVYPLIISDYKEHLRDASIPHLSFHSFCRHYKVKIKSVRQWMYRHGLDVTTMRYDALLEECNHSPETALAHIKREYDSPLSHPEMPSEAYVLQPSEVIKGASITFPDGVIVDIRQTSPLGLTRFIDFYNRVNDKKYVQPE